MKINTRSRSRIFLIEFIIVILFFSASSAVIIKAFATSHAFRQRANDLTIASQKAQNIIEYAKASQTKLEYITQLEDLGAIKEKNDYRFYYNKNWKKQTASLGAHYSMGIEIKSTPKEQGEFVEIRVRFDKINHPRAEDEICLLKAAKYYKKQEVVK